MSEEKSFREIVYDEVKDADPPLFDVINDALSSHLDGELVINIVASYTITMRRTYFSCAMKLGSSVSSTEIKQGESHPDDQAGNRDQTVQHDWASSIFHRMCILADDRTTEIKEVYFKFVHSERKRPQTKRAKKGRNEITAPGSLFIARTAVRASLSCQFQVSVLVQSPLFAAFLSTLLTSEVLYVNGVTA